MPRQIIDTESSRPRYIRRMVLTTVLVVLVAAIVIVAVFGGLGHLPHAPVPGK